MGATTGDTLPWPEPAEPANVPQDMQELATATQTALDKKAPVQYSQVNISRTGGWGHATYQPLAMKTGKSIALSYRFGRASPLTVTAGTIYPLGTLPAGYWPKSSERFTCPMKAGSALRVAHVAVGIDGSVSLIPIVNDTLDTDDWVFVSGITFVTA